MVNPLDPEQMVSSEKLLLSQVVKKKSPPD